MYAMPPHRRRVLVAACCLVASVLLLTTGKPAKFGVDLSSPGNVDENSNSNSVGSVGIGSIGSDEDVDATIAKRVGGDGELPTGSLAQLQQELSDIESKEAAAKQAVTDTDTQAQSSLEVLLAEGKQVASTEKEAKKEKDQAQAAQSKAERDVLRAKALLVKADRYAKAEIAIQQKMNATMVKQAADEAKKAALEAPIADMLGQIDDNENQFRKDSMTLAEQETDVSHITDAKLLATAKANLKVMLDKVEAESKTRHGLEKRVRQMEMLASKLTILDPSVIAEQQDAAKKAAEDYEKKAESATSEATEEQSEADELTANQGKLTAQADTTAKLADNESKELALEMAKHSQADAAHKAALQQYEDLETRKRRLEKAIALQQPHVPTTLVGHTVAADAVDRAAESEIPSGDNGPLSDEIAAQKRRQALKQRIEDAEREHAENMEPPVLPGGGGGGGASPP